MQEVLGEVLAVADPGNSVTAFANALELQQEAFASGTGPCPSDRLLTNTGVLEYRSKRYNKALTLLQSALDQLQQKGQFFSRSYTQQARLVLLTWAMCDNRTMHVCWVYRSGVNGSLCPSPEAHFVEVSHVF